MGPESADTAQRAVLRPIARRSGSRYPFTGESPRPQPHLASPRDYPIIEIIGPAGAGKSTLGEVLCSSEAQPTTGLSLWNLPRRFLLASAVALAPAATAAACTARRFHAPELAQMIRMGALRQAVDRARRLPRPIVLDEGPVFGITWLDIFFARNGDREWAAWRRAAVHKWAQCLDAIVWVDADDATILRRIRTRAKDHPVKNSTDFEIRAFTANFRTAFARVIEDLMAVRRVRVLKVRTDVITPNALAIRVRAVLNGRRGNGR